jgi:SAM-dependent methyltransferase
MSLLDCGCGPGSITLDLAQAVAPGRVIGIDIEPRQIEAARTLAADQRVTNACFEVASTYELPFPDSAFDAVFANTVLLHLREPRRALAEMRRVLKPGGIVGVADGDFSTWLWEPATPVLEQCRDLFLRVLQHNGLDPFLARHYRRLLLESGFARSEAYGRVSSETCGTATATREAAARIAQQLRTPGIGGVATEQGWITAGELEAMASAVSAWGERPDAFFALFDCAALGWAADAV